MKKTYSKPDIVFESFSLSTSIAAVCEYSTNFAQNVCGFKFGSDKIYMQDISGCEEKFEDGKFDGFCYHNPTDDKNIFSS